MASLDLLYLIVFLVFPLFLIGYYAPLLNRKKPETIIKSLVEFSESIGMGLLIYTPLVVLIYIILSFLLNLTPSGALSFQSYGQTSYYLTSMFSSADSFLNYLTGTINIGAINGFFPSVIYLIIFPMIVIGAIRFCFGKFHRELLADFSIYTASIFIPSLIILLIYNISSIPTSNYGIYSFNSPLFFIGLSIFLLGYITVLIFYAMISGLLIEIKKNKLKKEKVFLRLAISFFLIFMLCMVLYGGYVTTAIRIFYSPALIKTTVNTTMNYISGSLVTQQCGSSIINPVNYCKSLSYTATKNITETFRFYNGGLNFTILPEYGNFSYSNVRRGILPSYKFVSCAYIANQTCIENSTNNVYKKYILIENNNSRMIDNFSIFMNYNSNRSISNTVKINFTSDNFCPTVQVCLTDLSLTNNNFTTPTTIYLVYYRYLNASLENVSLNFVSQIATNDSIFCYQGEGYNSSGCSYDYVTFTDGNYSYRGALGYVNIMPYQYQWKITGTIPPRAEVNFYMTFNYTKS